MVLVRKTELACRQGWDQDLWEPRESAARSTGTATSGGGARRRPPARDRLSVPSGTSTSDEAGADHVVDMGIAAGLSDSARSESTREGDDSPLNLPKPDLPTDTPSVSNGDYQSLWSSRPMNKDQGEDRLQDETVVPRFGTRREEWDEPSLPPAKPSVFPIPVDVDVQPVNGSDQQDEREKQGGRPRPEGAEVHGERLERREPVISAQAPLPDVSRSSVTQSGRTEQYDVPLKRPGNEPIPDPDAGVEAVATAEAEPDSDPGDSPAIQLPMLKNQKPSCRNCRDFLPSKEGVGGWCSNPFAFEQRRRVHGDQIECQSSFGSWWSPSDDWWMERADIAHHSAPTPLFDNLIRQLRNRYFGVEGSTEGQERS
jgi:hypothetical protein